MDTPEQVTPAATETAAPAETETVTALPTPEDFKKLQDALKDANKEAAARRKKLEAFEKAEADRKAAEMTELEKAQAKLKEYETQLTNAKRAAIAAKHGLPETLAKRLQGMTIEEMEADAEEIAAALPKQSAAQPPEVKPTSPSNATTLTPEAIRKMSYQQINDNWEQVQHALANQK